MLRNFITTDDLKEHYPTIVRQIWSTQADFAPQIAQGFEHLQNDLWNKGINPRLCMVPLDLKATASKVPGAPLTVTTETAATDGQPFEGLNQRRLVADFSAHAGDWLVRLQGTNSAAATPPEDTWVDVDGAELQVGSQSADGERSVVFYDQFKQYRYQSSCSAGASAAYAMSLVEAIFDHAIINSAFKLIYKDFVKEKDDVWDARLQEAKFEYDSDLSLIKYSYDERENGSIEPDEQRRTGRHTFLM